MSKKRETNREILEDIRRLLTKHVKPKNVSINIYPGKTKTDPGPLAKALSKLIKEGYIRA